MIHLIQNVIFSSNTYLLSDSENNTCLIIDPGLNEELIDREIYKLGYKPIGIIATHGHFDHIGSAAFFQKKYKIPFYLHEKDFKISQSANFFLKIAKINHKIITPKPDFFINGKLNEIKIENLKLKVHNYPGHSDGGTVIEYKNSIFTGDLFYKKGLGFNGFPGENKSKLRKSIIDIFNNFEDDCVFYPGHGKFETIGYIRNNNLDLIEFLNNYEG